MLSTELRSEFCDLIDVLYKNIDLINELYLQCLAESLDEVAEEESHIVFCTVIAVCLINGYDTIKFPLKYSPEDEKLIYDIVTRLDLILNIEEMAKKGS
jgi:hypothetical protein